MNPLLVARVADCSLDRYPVHSDPRAVGPPAGSVAELADAVLEAARTSPSA